MLRHCSNTLLADDIRDFILTVDGSNKQGKLGSGSHPGAGAGKCGNIVTAIAADHIAAAVVVFLNTGIVGRNIVANFSFVAVFKVNACNAEDVQLIVYCQYQRLNASTLIRCAATVTSVEAITELT